MSDEKLDISESNIDLDIKVTTDDLVNIGVAQIENDLRRKRNQLKSELARLAQTEKKLQEQLEKDCKAVVSGRFTSAITAIQNAFGGIMPVEVKVAWIGILENKKIVFQVQVNGAPVYSKAKPNCNTNPSFPIPPKIRNILKEIEKNAAEKKTTTEELGGVMTQLSNLDYHERQVRAAVSQKVVLGSDQGRKLLKAFQDTDIVPRLNAGL